MTSENNRHGKSANCTRANPLRGPVLQTTGVTANELMRTPHESNAVLLYHILKGMNWEVRMRAATNDIMKELEALLVGKHGNSQGFADPTEGH